MNLSAILVVTSPCRVSECIAALSELPGITHHHSDPVTGKILITQEAESIDDEIEGLKRIKALAGVSMAEMVYHYFEDDETLASGIPAGLDEFQGLGQLPDFIKNGTK